jgi:hypothetical protein
MHPEFIRLGPLDIRTYGVLVAVGFMVGLAVAAWRARREGIDPERVTDFGVWLVISGMLGGKLFHILFFWNDFVYGWQRKGCGRCARDLYFMVVSSPRRSRRSLYHHEAIADGQDGAMFSRHRLRWGTRLAAWAVFSMVVVTASGARCRGR